MTYSSELPYQVDLHRLLRISLLFLCDRVVSDVSRTTLLTLFIWDLDDGVLRCSTKSVSMFFPRLVLCLVLLVTNRVLIYLTTFDHRVPFSFLEVVCNTENLRFGGRLVNLV
jgi:hypothetical protein